MDEEIEFLVLSMNSLYETLKAKENSQDVATQTNSSDYQQISLLQLIPKHVFRKIFLYLDFITDIPSLSESCVYFNSIINSRRFQVSLYHIISAKAHKSRSVTLPARQDNDFTRFRTENESYNKEDLTAQLKTANAVRDFLANKILLQEKRIEESNKEIDKLNDELRVQKQINSKTIAKVAIVSAQFEAAKNEAFEAKETIELMSHQQKEETEKLRNDIAAYDKEKLELRRHKKVLSAEVIRLRDEYQSCLQKLGQYNDAVSKLKSYFDAMVSTKVTPIIKQIKEQGHE